jgi:hypothetical protein
MSDCTNPLPAGPETFEAAIRQEKFAEDALAETCEALRVELAEKVKTIEIMTRQLADRRIPWISAMAAELLAHSAEQRGQCNYVEVVVKSAAQIYAETERQLAQTNP